MIFHHSTGTPHTYLSGFLSIHSLPEIPSSQSTKNSFKNQKTSSQYLLYSTGKQNFDSDISKIQLKKTWLALIYSGPLSSEYKEKPHPNSDSCAPLQRCKINVQKPTNQRTNQPDNNKNQWRPTRLTKVLIIWIMGESVCVVYSCHWLAKICV